MKSRRPVYLNLFEIRQSLPAWVSFAHRISGAILFLGIPFMLVAVEAFLRGSAVSAPLFRAALFSMLAAYAFHFFSGIRFLLLDMHWGVGLRQSRRAAWIVIAAATLSVAALGYGLW